MLTTFEKVSSAQRLLRTIFGVVPIAAGSDKFFNLLTNWTQYIDPRVGQMLPASPETFMHVVGIIEILAGLVVLSRFTTLGAYVVSAWLGLIALSLIASGKYLDVAVRDLVMSAGAYTLASLSQAVESAEAPAHAESGLKTA